MASWISTICRGSPVRRSEVVPSMTPRSPVTLWVTLVPQP